MTAAHIHRSGAEQTPIFSSAPFAFWGRATEANVVYGTAVGRAAHQNRCAKTEDRLAVRRVDHWATRKH